MACEVELEINHCVAQAKLLAYKQFILHNMCHSRKSWFVHINTDTYLHKPQTVTWKQMYTGND